MSWFRIDDQFGDHPKLMRLDESMLPAVGLLSLCGVYCSKHLTDGFVPRAVIRMYRGERFARMLERAGFFEPCDGGYVIHDYLDWNPSREAVLERRAKRQASGQAGGLARAQALATPVAKQTPNPVPVPVSQVLQEVPSNGAEWAEPADVYQSLTRRKALSKKERDWLEDLHARFSRRELLAALRAVERGPDFLRRVDQYLEAS